MKLILKEPCRINGLALPAGEVIEWPHPEFPLLHAVQEVLPDATPAKFLAEEDSNGNLTELLPEE